MGIIQRKATITEVSRPYDLSLSKVESWVGVAKRGMENVLWANALDVSIFKLYSWFNIPRRIVYYKPIKAMIEQSPFFGYRTVVI